ncbi:MAG: hypothetical protein IPP96_09640 [Chitinophagaceae bacterium]|nr:hypothetical protein [Chitinophagaceae bacterium]
MIKPLRKRHLQIWSLLAVLIPAGIISGYMVVPEKATSNLLEADNSQALPVVINKLETKNYSVYLRSSIDKKNYQLQWVNTKASTQPSSLIYKGSIEEKELIGRIGSTGTYYFPLKADTTGRYKFIVYDIIHRQMTDSIKF